MVFNPRNLRIGLGTDFHTTEPGDAVTLSGVSVPSEVQLVGHSDADLVLHAVIDALIGAIGEGDIGSWFPDTDPAYKGADSSRLLGRVMERVNELKFIIVNADVVIQCEQPKLKPYRDKMRRNLAQLLNIDETLVNIKAKTNEGCDAIGRQEAMGSMATVLLYKED